jgi:hypothetical protein
MIFRSGVKNDAFDENFGGPDRAVVRIDRRASAKLFGKSSQNPVRCHLLSAFANTPRCSRVLWLSLS